MKRYVIKRDEGSLPEKLTRYREELNAEQFRFRFFCVKFVCEVIYGKS